MDTTITIAPTTVEATPLGWLALILQALAVISVIGGISAAVTLLVVRRALNVRRALTTKKVIGLGATLVGLGLVLLVASIMSRGADNFNTEAGTYAQITRHQSDALTDAGFKGVTVTYSIGQDDHPLYDFTATYNGRTVNGALFKVDQHTYMVQYNPTTN